MNAYLTTIGLTRGEKQQAIVDAYLKEPPMRGSLVLSVGFGKSKVALDIVKGLEPKNIVLLTNSTQLRDVSWKDEFYKWNMGDVWGNVLSYTYQYIYNKQGKLSLTKDDLIIADEVDFAGGTEELAKFLEVFPNTRVLGLTGYITESKQDWFKENLPILNTYTSEDAQKEGLLNKLHFVFVKYQLSQNPSDIEVKYGKGKSFKQSENNAYDYAEGVFRKSVSEKKDLEEAVQLGEISFDEYRSRAQPLDFKIKGAIRKRTDILFNSITSKNMAKTLIDYILANQANKVIVFSKRTKQSESICANTYNGSNKDAVNTENFNLFNKGDIRVLGVVDKINRGANMVGLNNAILESFYGSDTDATQKFGRLLRLDKDEVATIYVFLPYFMRKIGKNEFKLTDTQQITWARKMLANIYINTHETWDYRIVKD